MDKLFTVYLEETNNYENVLSRDLYNKIHSQGFDILIKEGRYCVFADESEIISILMSNEIYSGNMILTKADEHTFVLSYLKTSQDDMEF